MKNESKYLAEKRRKERKSIAGKRRQRRRDKRTRKTNTSYSLL